MKTATKKCNSIMEPLERKEKQRQNEWLSSLLYLKDLPETDPKNETVAEKKMKVAAPAKSAPPTMTSLLFVPFSKVSFAHDHTNSLIERVCQHMTDECGADAEGSLGILLTSKKAAQDGADNFAQSNGMFFLTSSREVLATAMLCSSNQISFIWTPPKHRRKGYSAELLSKIGDLWTAHTTSIPLWVCADKSVVGVPLKAGWVADGIANKDGTMDYFPVALKDRYIQRGIEMAKHRHDFASETMAFLELNKNPHEGQDAEWAVFMKNFPQPDVRKRLSRCRIVSPPPQQGKVPLAQAATWLKEKMGRKYLEKDKEMMVALMRAFIAQEHYRQPVAAGGGGGDMD